MIKAIMLIFEPGSAWDKIVFAQKSFRYVFFLFFLPLILVSIGGEVAGRIYLAKHPETEVVVRQPPSFLIAYGACEVVLSLAVAFIGAKVVKSVAETFHGRNTFTQCFTLVAYTLSPLFLVHLLDAYPGMNQWASFGIGMVLSVAALYHGVPRVLQPDPPHAFGLYLISVLLLSGIAALARLLSLLVLTGKIKMH